MLDILLSTNKYPYYAIWIILFTLAKILPSKANELRPSVKLFNWIRHWLRAQRIVSTILLVSFWLHVSYDVSQYIDSSGQAWYSEDNLNAVFITTILLPFLYAPHNLVYNSLHEKASKLFSDKVIDILPTNHKHYSVQTNNSKPKDILPESIAFGLIRNCQSCMNWIKELDSLDNKGKNEYVLSINTNHNLQWNINNTNIQTCSFLLKFAKTADTIDRGPASENTTLFDGIIIRIHDALDRVTACQISPVESPTTEQHRNEIILTDRHDGGKQNYASYDFTKLPVCTVQSANVKIDKLPGIRFICTNDKDIVLLVEYDLHKNMLNFHESRDIQENIKLMTQDIDFLSQYIEQHEHIINVANKIITPH